MNVIYTCLRHIVYIRGHTLIKKYWRVLSYLKQSFQRYKNCISDSFKYWDLLFLQPRSPLIKKFISFLLLHAKFTPRFPVPRFGCKQTQWYLQAHNSQLKIASAVLRGKLYWVFLCYPHINFLFGNILSKVFSFSCRFMLNWTKFVFSNPLETIIFVMI